MTGIFDAQQGPAYCGHCGLIHAGPCPRIKAIEYHPNGMVKRVEYYDPKPVASGGNQVMIPTDGYLPPPSLR